MTFPRSSNQAIDHTESPSIATYSRKRLLNGVPYNSICAL